MKTYKHVIGGAFLAIFLGIQCTTDPVLSHNEGSGSSTETAMVTGILYNKDGSFAVNAKVLLRKKNTLATPSVPLSEITKDALEKSQAVTADTVFTNKNGKFFIDSIDTGTYVIEAADNSNNLALIDSIPVTDPDSTVKLPPDTLRPAGAIKGCVRLSEGGDPREVFVLAFGIDRFTRVNADGSFKFTPLAGGKYDLRFITTLDGYGILNSKDIPVISEDTTDMDTIELPLTSLPTPRNVSISYDSMKQIVSLTWNKPALSQVKGFNIYRREENFNSAVKLNLSTIMDTVFIDTLIPGKTYEYSVAASDYLTEGAASEPIRLKAVAAFVIADTLFTVGSQVRSVALDVNSNYLFIKGNAVERYDSSGKFLNSWNVQGIFSDYHPFRYITVSDSGFIFIINNSGETFKYDSAGNLLHTFKTLSSGEFDILKDTLFIYNDQGERDISAYNTNGDSLFSFGQFPQSSIISINCDSTGLIHIIETFKFYYIRLHVFNRNGSILSTIDFEPVTLSPDYSSCSRFYIKDSCMIFSNFSSIYCYSTGGKLLWRFLPFPTIKSRVFFDLAGNIRMALPKGEIVTVERR